MLTENPAYMARINVLLKTTPEAFINIQNLMYKLSYIPRDLFFEKQDKLIDDGKFS